MDRKVTVPAGYARHLLAQARAQGLDVDDLLQQVGIGARELEQDQAVSAVRYGALYQHLMWSAQDEFFGMLSSGKVPNGTFRLMCHCIIHCRSLERAIWRCGDFLDICRGTLAKPVLVRKGRYAKLSLSPVDHVDLESFNGLLQEQPAEKVRTSLSMWHHFISWLIGNRLELKAAYFMFDEPEGVDHYRTLFQSEVKFSQHENAIIFPQRFLDYPVVQTEETLRGFLKTAPYQLIVMVDDDQSLKAQVVAMIGKDFSRELPGSEEVAKAVNMSVSTLRRRLLDEGTSYQKIKDDCRKAAAMNYMNSPQLAINDVAALMGFDEPSAFFRSFKKWTGMTPGEYRKSDAFRGLYEK